MLIITVFTSVKVAYTFCMCELFKLKLKTLIYSVFCIIYGYLGFIQSEFSKAVQNTGNRAFQIQNVLLKIHASGEKTWLLLKKVFPY